MKYAEVAVNSPIARRRSFCYSVPLQFNVTIGQAVWVPFGSKVLQGIVIKLTDFPSFEDTKEIADIISSGPLLSLNQVGLALWLSEYYLASLFDTVALMLPPGFEQRLTTLFQFSPQSIDLSTLSTEQRQMVKFFQDKDKVKLRELEKRFGKKKAEQVIRQLTRLHLLVKTEQLEDSKIRPKLAPYLKLGIDAGAVEAQLTQLRSARAFRQAEVIDYLARQPQPVSVAELRRSVTCQSTVIKSLKDRGLVSVLWVEVRRDPLANLSAVSSFQPVLTSSQEEAWQSIKAGLVYESHNGRPRVFLLEGVTGSGKTEIYLRTLAEVISQGRRGICLVPEIALTPQTIERFASRFPGRVAVFHSGLSAGERFDEWHRIKRGDCDVVIGPRSALFVPQPDLGLIVIDEEHEWTYKQSDKQPRYHAREAAIKFAELSGAAVILGSATPDVETFYRAQRGEFELVELKERITPRGISPLPEVEIVDVRDELKNGNRSLFSRSLYNAMADTLARREQIILFLNRRGTATFVQCRDCGFVLSCRHCLSALTFHSAVNKLICHHCNYSSLPPQACPLCFSQRLRFLGIGTQKVEDETRNFFPRARILRWDRDVTSRRRAHEDILAQFQSHQADILIGTQMIAKGLDLPQVTLAGVISADTGLNLPDFRASERTFQLLCQVAGRAGRGLAAGKVIIQTYSPDHYAVQAASRHDYRGFYRQEIGYRRQFGYPPFSHLARLVYSHTNADACHREVMRMGQLLDNEKDRKGIADLRLIGPAPTFVPRIRGRYQWQIVLCGSSLSEFLNDITFSHGWTVDIDPISVI